MEVSEYLVGSPAFKAGDTGDPRMAGSIPVHLRCLSRGRNPSASASSMLGGWPEAVTARTGFAASSYPGRSSTRAAIGGNATRFLRPSPSEPASQLRTTGRCFEPPGEKLEFGGANTFAASSYPAKVLALVLLAALMLFALSTPAGAAARLLSATPADGASLATLRTVEFEFDSLLIGEGAEVTVTKLDGTAFPAEATVDGSTLIGTVVGDLPSGNYEVAYAVRSADGDTNTGSIRIGVDAPDQALSGGLLAVVGIAAGLLIYLGLVFRADKRRRPTRR